MRATEFVRPASGSYRNQAGAGTERATHLPDLVQERQFVGIRPAESGVRTKFLHWIRQQRGPEKSSLAVGHAAVGRPVVVSSCRPQSLPLARAMPTHLPTVRHGRPAVLGRMKLAARDWFRTKKRTPCPRKLDIGLSCIHAKCLLPPCQTQPLGGCLDNSPELARLAFASSHLQSSQSAAFLNLFKLA